MWTVRDGKVVRTHYAEKVSPSKPSGCGSWACRTTMPRRSGSCLRGLERVWPGDGDGAVLGGGCRLPRGRAGPVAAGSFGAERRRSRGCRAWSSWPTDEVYRGPDRGRRRPLRRLRAGWSARARRATRHTPSPSPLCSDCKMAWSSRPTTTWTAPRPSKPWDRGSSQCRRRTWSCFRSPRRLQPARPRVLPGADGR